LQSFGIPVAQKERISKPDDWPTCRSLINLFSNPDNDLLAFWWIDQQKGKKVAEKMKLEAARNYLSINDQWLRLPRNMPVKDVPAALARCGISRESVALVVKAIDEWPTKPMWLTDLSFALGDDELHRKEEGEGVSVVTMHCSPPDEPILTTAGYKNIADLNPATDRLLCLNGRCNQLSRGKNAPGGTGKGFAFSISDRPFQGDLVVIETMESRTRVTPEHRVRVRFDESFYGSFAVYLMRRGPWLRIGMCRSVGIAPYKSGGVSGRLASEKADAGWILGLYRTKKEALVAEATIQARYGITGLTFEDTRLLKDFSIADLHKVHSIISDEACHMRADRLFRDFGLLKEWPLYFRRRGQRRDGRMSAMHGYWFETAAANLISGYMRVPVALLNEFRYNARPRHLIATVTREPYSGPVYGIDVPPHRFYVSGGAIVHNSAKGREWDVVYLPALEEGIIPSLSKTATIEEERRLMFVAMTRARHWLVGSFAKHRRPMYGRGPASPTERSRFIQEMAIKPDVNNMGISPGTGGQ